MEGSEGSEQKANQGTTQEEIVRQCQSGAFVGEISENGRSGIAVNIETLA
jgi:hypothetical protein